MDSHRDAAVIVEQLNDRRGSAPSSPTGRNQRLLALDKFTQCGLIRSQSELSKLGILRDELTSTEPRIRTNPCEEVCPCFPESPTS